MGDIKTRPSHRLYWPPPVVLLLSLLLLVLPILFILSPYSVFPNHMQPEVIDPLPPHQLSDLAVVGYNVPLKGEEALEKILQLTADILDILGTEHQSPSLASLSKVVRAHVFTSHESHLIKSASYQVEKRGLLESLTSSLSNALSGAAGSLLVALGSITLDSLSTPALFFGNGLGAGTAKGLHLTGNSSLTTQIEGAQPTGTNLIAQNLGMGLTSTLFGSIDIPSLVSTASFSAAAESLGSGLGAGIAKGLSLSNATTTAKMNSNRTTNGNKNGTVNETGLSGIAASLGFGLTSSLFSSVNVSSLASRVNTDNIAGAVVAAGTGLGSGAAQGLQKISMAMVAPPVARTLRKRAVGGAIDVDGVAQNFTHSLSSSFIGSLDLKALAAMVSNGVTGLNITQMIGPIILSSGNGLGSGAAQGLGLQKTVAREALPPNADASTIAENFAHDLATSFLANGTVLALTKIVAAANSGDGVSSVTGMLGSIAEGVGSGLGQGTSVGLGYQNATPAMGNDAATIAKSFSFGLSSSFLANGSVSKLTSSIATSLANSTSISSALSNVSVSKAAEGLARGLVDGAGTSIQNAGGLQAILSGGNMTAIMMSAAAPVMSDSIPFDDSTGGVASAFGRGLGGEGINLVLAAFGQVPAATSPSAPGISSSSSLATLPTPTTLTSIMPDSAILPAPVTPETNSTSTNNTVMKNTGTSNTGTNGTLSMARRSPPRVAVTHALPRRRLTPRAANMTGIFASLNSTATDQILQTAIDTLTCDGIGGAVQLFTGLQSSGAFSSFSNSNYSSNLSGILPNIDLTVTNAGNKYDINPGTLDIKINGQSLIKFVVIIALHAVLATIAYLTLIPAALFLENARGIAINMRRPAIWANAGKWTRLLWLFAIIPISFIGFVLGIFVLNIGHHFQSAHGVSGLMAFIFTIPAAILEVRPVVPMAMSSRSLRNFRFVNLSLVLLFGLISFVSGLEEVRTISLCILALPAAAVSVMNILLMVTFLGAMSTIALNFLTAKWAAQTIVYDPFLGQQEDREVISNMDTKMRYTDEEATVQIRRADRTSSSTTTSSPTRNLF